MIKRVVLEGHEEEGGRSGGKIWNTGWGPNCKGPELSEGNSKTVKNLQ